ncbi:hypothetical protein [Sediminicoccus sp. BL-A-41-H5]|uniref:hypothetical protein n=1 Tax=Sediminicoccus sp. BL-A-41-H5 TaxID=3421106 RepID=UPI003D67D001
MKRALWLALPLLAACGSTPPPAPPPPDETLGRAARAGRLALELDRPAEAARLYATALNRARERDDTAAIGDAGIGLAAAQLVRPSPAAALTTSREVQAELLRRNAAIPDALRLVEALALYRGGDLAGAQQVAAGIGTEDPDVALRAWFLRGLIAAARTDQAALAEARAALGTPERRAFRADAEELAAAAALAQGDLPEARRLATAAATLRREGLDYRGLARALALEAEAARRQGEIHTAADLLLRAGRSAASRNEFPEARRWLQQAETLAREARAPEIANAARRALRDMAERERDARA